MAGEEIAPFFKQHIAVEFNCSTAISTNPRKLVGLADKDVERLVNTVNYGVDDTPPLTRSYAVDGGMFPENISSMYLLDDRLVEKLGFEGQTHYCVYFSSENKYILFVVSGGERLSVDIDITRDNRLFFHTTTF